MKYILFTFLLYFLIPVARAEVMQKTESQLEPGEEAVIDLSFLASVDFEDPIFPEPEALRDLASAEKMEKSVGFSLWGSPRLEPQEWRGGKLQVQKEIPYSHPWLTRSTIEARVLEEIKAEKAKKSPSE